MKVLLIIIKQISKTYLTVSLASLHNKNTILLLDCGNWTKQINYLSLLQGMENMTTKVVTLIF